MVSNRCFFVLSLATLAVVVGCSSKSPTNSQTKNSVLWDAGAVRLQATDFYLEADSVKYLAKVDSVSVSGSSGFSDRTLELEWLENGVDMRLYIYLVADSVDWWSDEIRTYDGADNSDGTRWIYYFGEFFKRARGESFTGDVDLTSDASDNGVEGKLHFENMTLTAF